MHLATLCGLQDLSSPTRDWSHVHCRLPPNHWVSPSSCFSLLLYWWNKPVCKMLKFKDKRQNCFSGIGNCLTPLFRCTWKSLSRSYSLQPHGLYSPWNSPGQNTGVGSHSLLQGIFPTQGSDPGLLHYKQILYQLSHQEICWGRDHLSGSVFL